MNEDKIFKRHQNWIFYLTAMWLIASFEHNYYTLSNYNLHKTWNAFGITFPLSDLSAFLMVLALDLSLFWSIYFIPAAKRWNTKLLGVISILFISTVFSVILNVKYMVLASPTPSFWDYAIGAILGGLIPIFVILFGWIEGHLIDTRVHTSLHNANHNPIDFERTKYPSPIIPEKVLTNGLPNRDKPKIVFTDDSESDHNRTPTVDEVIEAKKDNPAASVRKLADKFKASIGTIQNRINEARRTGKI